MRRRRRRRSPLFLDTYAVVGSVGSVRLGNWSAPGPLWVIDRTRARLAGDNARSTQSVVIWSVRESFFFRVPSETRIKDVSLVSKANMISIICTRSWRMARSHNTIAEMRQPVIAGSGSVAITLPRSPFRSRFNHTVQRTRHMHTGGCASWSAPGWKRD